MQPVALPKLRIDKRTSDAQAPFEIPCVCGNILRGQRQPQAQTISCPQCQTDRFVLPLSALPMVVEGERATVGGGSRKGGLPLIVLAGVPLFLIAFVAVFAVTLYFVFRKSPSSPTGPQTPQERMAARRDAGRAAIADGSFQRAAIELKGALDIADWAPGVLGAAERRELNHLQRQAAILADLSSETLAEIVRYSIGTPEAEWQAIFSRRFVGHSVILDETLHRDAAGNYHGSYRIQVTGSECRVDRKALKVLKDVDLSAPKRVLLGFRLSSLRREPTSGWTILPDPDSGVFLTDPQMLKGLSVPDDSDLQEVLKRQKGW